MAPQLRHLSVFLTLADRQSFTRAGEAFGLTQPAVSLIIQQLEAELDAQLVTRQGGRVALTAHGRQFLPMARHIVNTAEATTARFQQLVRHERGLVSVAALPSLAASLLPAAIEGFQARHPDIYPVVRDALSQDLLALVREGASDIGLGYARRPRDTGGLDVRPVMQDRLVALVPRRHPFAERAAITWEMLAVEALIGLDVRSSTRQLVDAAMAEAGVTPHYVSEVSFLATAAAMSQRGFGIAVIPELGRHLIPASELVDVPVAGPAVTRDICLIARRDRELGPAPAAFYEHLDTFLKEGGRTGQHA